MAARSGGKITVKLFAGGSLGGDLQTVSALQGGTVELTVLNAGILSAQVKEFAAYTTFRFCSTAARRPTPSPTAPSARS
jgi:TRAP-type C4-dicarboxylate transport system substrate-binding protein